MGGRRASAAVRLTAIVVATTPLTAVLASGAPAADGLSRACSRGTTVLANDRARVFSVDAGDIEMYACRRGDRRPLDLGFYSRTNGVSAFRLAGEVVGYRITGEGCSRGECRSARVVSHSLRTRRIVRQIVGARQYVLKANGSLGALTFPTADAPLSVVRSDARGTAVLDPGPVDAGSLALARDRIYWTAGGTARSAPLE